MVFKSSFFKALFFIVVIILFAFSYSSYAEVLSSLETSSILAEDEDSILVIFSSNETIGGGLLWSEGTDNDIYRELGNIGIGTSTPNTYAKLDITADDKGLLIPRLSTESRDAITSPPNGLIIYNTTTNCFNFYNGSFWYQLCGNCIPPSAPIASSNSPVCSGDTLKLYANTISDASYSWTGPNGFTSNIQNPTINSTVVPNAGTYNVTATVNGCVSSVGTTNITINSSPLPTFTPLTVYVSIATTFIPTETGASYSWTFQNGSPSSSGSQNPIVTWNNVGNYNVSLTVTKNGCTSDTTISVSIVLPPASCKVIKDANPSATNGIYTIDPDGLGGNSPISAYCQMSLNNGGWTEIWKATTNNYGQSSGWAYNTGCGPIALNATEFMVAYTDESLNLSQAWKFDAISSWKNGHPFNAQCNQDNVTATRISDALSLTTTLISGTNNFNISYCSDVCDISSVFGRTCLRRTGYNGAYDFPFYNAYSYSGGVADYCSNSDTNYNTTVCSDSRRFIIFAR